MMRSGLAVIAISALACGSTGGASDGDAGTGSDGSGYHPDAGPIGNLFRFGVVGDTRPAGINGTSSYPTPIITKIWADMQAESPHPDFAVSTGDYMFASTTSGQAAPQLAKYLTARMQFTSPVYAALGNHECTGATTSNCGPGTTDGVTDNYTQFMNHMVIAEGQSNPYYAVSFHDPDNAWTAKVVLVAANAWTAAQATWLETTLAEPTTYTFIVRHESDSASTAPGVSPSKLIINRHPYTLLIVGHDHTYQRPATREVICGTGGAPLVSGVNYGYGIVERLASGDIQFTQSDYETKAIVAQWRLHPDGSAAP